MPIALSFALLTKGYGYSPLVAFAAGAALSSTSLGTTLAALSSVSRQTDSFHAIAEEQKHSEGMLSMYTLVSLYVSVYTHVLK